MGGGGLWIGASQSRGIVGNRDGWDQNGVSAHASAVVSIHHPTFLIKDVNILFSFAFQASATVFDSPFTFSLSLFSHGNCWQTPGNQFQVPRRGLVLESNWRWGVDIKLSRLGRCHQALQPSHRACSSRDGLSENLDQRTGHHELREALSKHTTRAPLRRSLVCFFWSWWGRRRSGGEHATLQTNHDVAFRRWPQHRQCRRRRVSEGTDTVFDSKRWPVLATCTIHGGENLGHLSNMHVSSDVSSEFLIHTMAIRSVWWDQQSVADSDQARAW